MEKYIDKAFYLLASFFRDTFSVISEKPLYNEELIWMFSNPKDKQKLVNVVRDMKHSHCEKSRQLKLESGEIIKIVLK